METVTIKQLHEATGEWVRRAGASRTPVVVTVRGKPVAVLASSHLIKRKKRRRTLLPEYEALMAQPPLHDLMEDLHAVRNAR